MGRQVMLVSRREALHDHERIEAIGGVENNALWKDLEEEAIKNIERDPTSYFVRTGTHSSWLIVANYNGRKYLKSACDSYAPDALLCLPDNPRG